MTNHPNRTGIPLDKIDKAAVKAMKATNLCTKHMEYHGQKFKDCTPQERTMYRLSAVGAKP